MNSLALLLLGLPPVTNAGLSVVCSNTNWIYHQVYLQLQHFSLGRQELLPNLSFGRSQLHRCLVSWCNSPTIRHFCGRDTWLVLGNPMPVWLALAHSWEVLHLFHYVIDPLAKLAFTLGGFIFVLVGIGLTLALKWAPFFSSSTWFFSFLFLQAERGLISLISTKSRSNLETFWSFRVKLIEF